MKQPETTKVKPKLRVHRIKLKKHKKAFSKPHREKDFHKDYEGKETEAETQDVSPNTKPENAEEDDEEILRKYASKPSLKEYDVEPGRCCMSLSN